MEDGKNLDQKNTKKAFNDYGITLKSFKKTQTVLPTITYTLNVSGLG